MNKKISRRGVLKYAPSGAAAALIPTLDQAHADTSVANYVYSVGSVPSPHVYYEVLRPLREGSSRTIVMVHGGLHTGAGYLHTVDGRPGWAQFFASRGYKVIVPDWPGTGRSGYIPPDRLDGATVSAGLGQILAALDEPAVLLVHSISGAFGWKLLEMHGDKVSHVVAVAPSGPGNILPEGKILKEENGIIEVNMLQFNLKISSKDPFLPDEAWSKRKLVGEGFRFPKESVDSYLRTLTALSPRILYERLNVEGSQLKIADYSHFAGKPILVLIGTHDVDHSAKIDMPTVEWLNKNGAKAEFLPLSQVRIEGNGHMMMLESNSDEVAKVIEDWIKRTS